MLEALHSRLRRRFTEKVLQPALAGLLAVMVLSAAILSASPSLHAWFHHESSTPSHACVVCLFAQSQLSAAEVSVAAVVLAGAYCFFARPFSQTAFASFDYRLSPSRAPPRG
jgi:hypothetical protein